MYMRNVYDCEPHYRPNLSSWLKWRYIVGCFPVVLSMSRRIYNLRFVHPWKRRIEMLKNKLTLLEHASKFPRRISDKLKAVLPL